MSRMYVTNYHIDLYRENPDFVYAKEMYAYTRSDLF